MDITGNATSCTRTRKIWTQQKGDLQSLIVDHKRELNKVKLVLVMLSKRVRVFLAKSVLYATKTSTQQQKKQKKPGAW